MVVKLGCAIQCEGIADCTWVSVVKEPSEGELVEPVVVPVDILVALRPARIFYNVCHRKEKNSSRTCKAFVEMCKIYKGRDREQIRFFTFSLQLFYEKFEYLSSFSGLSLSGSIGSKLLVSVSYLKMRCEVGGL